MAYRCPVCDNPETDAEHLANHLAFTAVIRGDDHESWLDEHVPEWGDDDPDSLAPKVAEAVPAVEVPELDDGDESAGHDHGARLEDELAQQGGHRGPGATGTHDAAGASGASAGGRGDLTEDAAGVMQEARELTEKMYGLDDEGDESTDGDADGDADAAAADDADTVDDAGSESE
ncbi:DUF5810 domain-containing protein [Halorubellus sp. PRR65]|uniref:DUF5810 domain-containing protein n=1 Tax=Halorubellus sp. PRR65 TaxID=3098148 RepID=UPI002B2606D3|nr:DUF5810 domain-containing protein [Halorubellus sp. PRR65]